MKYKLVKLGKLCKIKSGGTPRRGVDDFYGGNILWAKIGDIENAKEGCIIDTIEKITSAGLKSINNKIFSKNTVFLAMYGSVGKTSIAGREMSTNQAILGLNPNNSDELNYKYLKYWLDYSKNDLISKARGVALKNISATIVKNFNIPLPPLEDQKRIVKILDKANSLCQKRKKAINHLDDYLKSVFLEMFGDPVKNPKKWPIKDFKHFAKIDTNMTKDFEKFADFPHIGIDSIEKKTGKIKNYKIVSELSLKSGKYLFTPEHIIYSKIRPNLNKVALPDFDGLSSADSYPILVDKKTSNKYFFAFILRSDAFLDYAKGFSRRANIPKINKKQLLGFKCIAPDVELQDKFKDVYQKIEKIRQKMLSQSQELENQFQSLLQKAFKGEL